MASRMERKFSGRQPAANGMASQSIPKLTAGDWPNEAHGSEQVFYNRVGYVSFG